MNRNSLLLVGLLISFFVVVGYRFFDYQINQNYVIYTTISCNPQIESCFVYACDESDPECEQTPYKKLTIHASSAPSCALEHSCEDFFCTADMPVCEIANCTDEQLEDGESCLEISPEDTAVDETITTEDETVDS